MEYKPDLNGPGCIDCWGTGRIHCLAGLLSLPTDRVSPRPRLMQQADPARRTKLAMGITQYQRDLSGVHMHSCFVSSYTLPKCPRRGTRVGTVISVLGHNTTGTGCRQAET